MVYVEPFIAGHTFPRGGELWLGSAGLVVGSVELDGPTDGREVKLNVGIVVVKPEEVGSGDNSDGIDRPTGDDDTVEAVLVPLPFDGS